jgi:cytochrome c-type biogenesis protein CcmH/NrfG
MPDRESDETVREVDAQVAADKVTAAAEKAEQKVMDDARATAAALTSEVQVLRQDITTLQHIDTFKARVYVVALVAAIFAMAGFISLWIVAHSMQEDTNAIRTDLEVHRIRNEASHDCLAEKMAKLPPPEVRINTTDAAITRAFVQEFLGCVTEIAPSIVPPGAPDIRVHTREEREDRP